MQMKEWIRFGLAFALLGGGVGGATLAGCSGDDSGPATPAQDAGPDNSLPPPDSGGNMDTGVTPDTGNPGDDGGDGAAPGNANAKVYVVHASETAPPLRFCFGIATGTSVTVLSLYKAAPDDDSNTPPGQPFPGLFPGQGGPLDTHGVDLAPLSIVAFAINAQTISGDVASNPSERNCADLVGMDGTGKAGGTGALTEGTDYWSLGTIPAGMLAHGSSWLFAVTGCQAGVSAQVAPFCGSDYDGGSNFGFTSFHLDSTTAVAPTALGAQFAHASQAWDSVGAAGGAMATAAGFYVPADAGTVTVPDGGADAGAGQDAAPDVATTEAGDDAAADATSGDDATADAAGDDAAGDDASSADSAIGDAPGEASEAPDSGGGMDGGTMPAMPATTPIPLTIGTTFGHVVPMTLQSVQGLTFDGTSGFFAQLLNGTTPVGPPAALPLPVVQELTYGATVPEGGVPLANGAGFVFVLVGNPAQPTFIDPADGGASSKDAGGVFNGRSVHFLAFPTLNQ